MSSKCAPRSFSKGKAKKFADGGPAMLGAMPVRDAAPISGSGTATAGPTGLGAMSTAPATSAGQMATSPPTMAGEFNPAQPPMRGVNPPVMKPRYSPAGYGRQASRWPTYADGGRVKGGAGKDKPMKVPKGNAKGNTIRAFADGGMARAFPKKKRC